MNATPAIPTKPPLLGDDEDYCQIAIAFHWPRDHRGVSLLGLDRPFAFVIFARCLQWALREHLINGEALGAAGDLCNGLILFDTTNRPAALKIVMELRRRAVLSMSSAVAWFDNRGEQVWVVVEHGVYPVQFSEYLSPEQHELRLAITEKFSADLSNSISALDSQQS